MVTNGLTYLPRTFRKLWRSRSSEPRPENPDLFFVFEIVQFGDTTYYDVESPSPSRPAGGTWPVDQKHDLNLTDLTWFSRICDLILDSKRKNRFCKNSAPACTGAQFEINKKSTKKSMQNKNEKMMHVFTSWLSKTWKIRKNMLKNAKKSKLQF